MKSSASRKTLLTATVLSIAAVFGAAYPGDSADAKLKPKMGYKLVMKVTYFGRVEWEVSADGSRLTSPILSVVCQPPSFDTILFNTESKKMKKFSSKSGFERIGMMVQGGKKKFIYSPWKKVGTEVVAGRQCDKYLRHMLNSDQNERFYTTLEEEYWVSPLFALPHIEELMAPLAKLTTSEYGLGRGFGMRRVATWKVFRKGDPVPKKNERLVHLDTTLCKQAMVNPEIFVVGKDYTPVKDEGELMFSDEGAMPGFGGGRPNGL